MAPRKTKTVTTTKAAKTAAGPRAEPGATPKRARRANPGAPLPVADSAPVPASPPPALPPTRREPLSRDLAEPWTDDRIEAPTRTVNVISGREPAGVDPPESREVGLDDEIVDQRIADSLRSQAADGDLRSQALYFKCVRELILSPARGRGHNEVLSGPEAEAIIRAGLEAYEARIDAPPPRPRHPLPSDAMPGKKAT